MTTIYLWYHEDGYWWNDSETHEGLNDIATGPFDTKEEALEDAKEFFSGQSLTYIPAEPDGVQYP